MAVSTTHRFDPLEKAIQEEFFPALFGEAIDEEGEYRLELAYLPQKYSGLALPNTVHFATPNPQACIDVCSHLTRMRQPFEQLRL